MATPAPEPTRRNVPSRAEVAGWTADERAAVARLLNEVAEHPDVRRYRRRRQVVLAVTGAGALLLAPWVVYLTATLPNTVTSGAWKVAWVGFDIGLIGVFAATAWMALRRRQIVVVLLGLAATMMVVDAWFDVTLSWGTGEQLQAVLTALGLELPIAAFLLGTALVALRRVVATVAALRGQPSGHVSIWRAPSVMLGPGSDLPSPTGDPPPPPNPSP